MQSKGLSRVFSNIAKVNSSEEAHGEVNITDYEVALLYVKWITNKDLLYSTGNSVQYHVEGWMGREFGGEWIHAYVWLSPFAVHLKLSQHY